MKKLPFSIIIITDQSDDRFIQALESAQFVDEILIFDDASGNNWKKLSSLYSFKVKPIKDGIKDFSQIRNQAIEQAKHDWVFFLDSDEIITKKSQQFFAEIFNKKPFLNAAAVRRIDYFLGKKMNWGEVKNVWITRLLKKNKVKFERPVHEKANLPGLIYQSKIILNHYSHNSINEFIKDISNYAQMEADYRIRQQKISKLSVIWQMLTYPTSKFIVNYFLKLGFLDGMHGLIYALMMSIHSMSVRIFIYEKINQKQA